MSMLPLRKAHACMSRPLEVKCVPELILLLLSDVMAHCVASTFEVNLPTRSEMHMAVDVYSSPPSCMMSASCKSLPVEQLGLSTILFFLVNSIFQHGLLVEHAKFSQFTQYHTIPAPHHA